ncbi:hypothetical protein C8J57DRAFT_1296401, partial [Mycena rebaudengoi]
MHTTQFSAWVSIDGVVAKEYGPETSVDGQTMTCSCWIASEIGKTFSVHWRNASYYHATTGDVAVDGNFCGAYIIRAHKVPCDGFIDGIDNGTVLRAFTFSPLTLTDDDAFLGQSSHQLEELGVIELCLKPIDIRPICTGVHLPVAPLSELKVHERSKKAITQQITLGQPKPSPATTLIEFDVAGPDLVKFKFKYRPLDVLQANGIAPPPVQLKRKASAPLDPEQRLSEELADAEEAKILREKLKAIEAKQAKRNPVKREKPTGGIIDLTQGSSSKRAKLEGGKVPFVAGEIIDL